jgi:hypothetical protein
MSDSTPDRSAVVAQRLAEAAQIESEWNTLSYKDRASWWMSAKWYGYQSADAYRRGDDAQPNESCRYGEPGFFIATRVPYFEAQAAVAQVVATTTVEPADVPVTAVTESTTSTSPTEPVVAEPAVETEITPSVAKVAAVAATTQPSNTHHKKKKKNKHHAEAGAGKTIEISMGR